MYLQDPGQFGCAVARARAEEIIPVNVNRSQEGYPLKVHLSPEALAFLETQYPGVDPELGLVHLVDEARHRAKRSAAAKVQVLDHPAYALSSPPSSSRPSTPAPEPIEPVNQAPGEISPQTQLSTRLVGK